VVKTPTRVFIAENGLNIRRISVGSKSCPSRKFIGWAVGVNITSRRYYGRRKPIFGRQDDRLVKAPTRVFIAENGINIRRISVGLKSCPSRKSIGWAVGVTITSHRYYGRRKPNIKRAGWPSG
jgi:hypothetical protein